MRENFILPDNGIYLNCANMSPLHKSVEEAGQRALAKRTSPWTITSKDWFEDAEVLRKLASRIFQSLENDIALVPSASYGLATAAKNLPLNNGGTIIVLENQYPSNYYVWQELARKHQLKLKTVARSGTKPLTECLLAEMDDQTRLVAIPNVHWIDGALIDLSKISKRVKELGAFLVLDLSQSLCALPVNMREVDPDFAVSVGYKWQLGAYGLAYLYVAPRHQGGEPLEYSWMTRRGADDFTKLTKYTNEFKEGARRFDMGEYSQFHLLPMSIAGLHQVLEYGVVEINQKIATLTARVRDFKLSSGICEEEIPTAHHIVSLPLEGLNADGIMKNLQKKNITVSFRGTSIRVSPYTYNSIQEIDEFLSCIET